MEYITIDIRSSLCYADTPAETNFVKGVFMKSVKMVSIVLACLTALVFLSCDNGGGGGESIGSVGPGSGGAAEAALNGTWVDDRFGNRLILNNGNFQFYEEGIPLSRGTITVSGNRMTIIVTQFHGAAGLWVWLESYGRNIRIPLTSRWYSRTEVISAATNHLRGEGISDWAIGDALGDINQWFMPYTTTFVLVGNFLSLPPDDYWPGDTYPRFFRVD